MYSIDTIKERITPIAKDYGVKRVYLFGSYANNTANDESDVDLLIEKGVPLSLVMLSGMLQDAKEALGVSVDLITTDGIEPDFQKQISGSEILLYEA